MTRLTFLLTIISTLVSIAAAIPTISITGSKFFTSDGYQFFIKGVAYQLTPSDPLTDTAQCERDAALMHTLGANSIRVYHVNATADHTGCMNAFAAKGIYLWVDLDSFTTYLGYTGVPSWTQKQSDSYRQIMDNFQQYTNTAGFFVGNEVVNSLADSSIAPYLLAAKVDLTAYSKAKGYRSIPIGYSAADILALRPFLQDYLACRTDATERLDFYALNAYEWCGSAATFESSGYNNLQAAVLNYPLPIFISETGCNNIRPRTFGEMNSILGPDMDDTWSGAIVYEWIQEWNDFGLVQYGPLQNSAVNGGSNVVTGLTSGSPTLVAPDFTNLQQLWATLDPPGVKSTQYAAAVKTTPKSCPASSATGWTVNPQAALPTLGQQALSGVTTGLPNGIPSGSITVSYVLSHNTSAPTDFSSRASYGVASSATSSAAGVRTIPSSPLSHVYAVEVFFFHAFTTLAGISVAAMLWL